MKFLLGKEEKTMLNFYPYVKVFAMKFKNHCDEKLLLKTNNKS